MMLGKLKDLKLDVTLTTWTTPQGFERGSFRDCGSISSDLSTITVTGMVDQKLMWTSTSTVVTRAEYPAGSNLSPCTQVFPPSTKHKS